MEFACSSFVLVGFYQMLLNLIDGVHNHLSQPPLIGYCFVLFCLSKIDVQNIYVFTEKTFGIYLTHCSTEVPSQKSLLF